MAEYTQMDAAGATGLIQTLEYIADGGNKDLNLMVKDYGRVLTDKKAMDVAKDITLHFSEALAERYMAKRGLIDDVNQPAAKGKHAA